MDKLEFTEKELDLFKKLNTPSKIQDFLNSIPINHEKNGVDTIKSPIRVVRENNAHCIEGALLGAYILTLHGYPGLILNLRASRKDLDHVIAVFQENRYWGALSKTNHSVLRYREPVYKNIRELVMSYFHEYFTDDGTKTLREYSDPLDLKVFEKDWMVQEKDLWGIDEELDKLKYHKVVPKKNLLKLRKADEVEIQAGKIIEWKK